MTITHCEFWNKKQGDDSECSHPDRITFGFVWKCVEQDDSGFRCNMKPEIETPTSQVSSAPGKPRTQHNNCNDHGNFSGSFCLACLDDLLDRVFDTGTYREKVEGSVKDMDDWAAGYFKELYIPNKSNSRLVKGSGCEPPRKGKVEEVEDKTAAMGMNEYNPCDLMDKHYKCLHVHGPDECFNVNCMQNCPTIQEHGLVCECGKDHEPVEICKPRMRKFTLTDYPPENKLDTDTPPGKKDFCKTEIGFINIVKRADSERLFAHRFIFDSKEEAVKYAEETIKIDTVIHAGVHILIVASSKDQELEEGVQPL